jgi:predicted acylesterase/phospholipase RssA
MGQNVDQAMEQFHKIIKGETASSQTLLMTAATLQRGNHLDEARRLLEKALLEYGSTLGDAGAIQTVRNLIMCTYKDTGLPAETRLRSAERMLLAIFGRPIEESPTALESVAASLSGALKASPSMNQELLGIAGAVEKRRWEFYGLRKHLVCASRYYSEGHAMGCAQDQGYNGINLAFVLDLLSQQEENEIDCGEGTRDRAAKVRKEIIDTLDSETSAAATPSNNFPHRSWWLLVTLGEAYLGIGDIVHATERMEQAATCMQLLATNPDEATHIAPWQLESVARQVVRVAQIQADREGFGKRDVERAPCWTAVQALLKAHSEAARTFLYGKIGLALSGGGFRASLFHIGVLARLAELDVLRHVEVLSCVSGGSIVGAHYYLELRNLLQTKTDEEIGRQDYLDLVERLRQGFVAGVQGNIRLQMLMGWRSNWRVLTSRRSSTSDRLADLFESELYAKVADGSENSPRYLANLRVEPCVGPTSESNKEVCKPKTAFNPKYDNWSRCNKVPVLILNATSLNTCHNWQFTASFMGEPPARSIDAEIDANHRMRRMYHFEAPPAYRRSATEKDATTGIRLGEAVAASACVPGLFDPLHLEDLYGEMGTERTEYMTELVDGGNYDNQGVASLREQDCSVLIISDACGQTAVSAAPKADHFGVMMRANNILMSRAREAQYQLLRALEDSGAIGGLMYLHLKKGLEAQTVDWVGCDDPSTFVPPSTTTDYGVRRDVQRLLAAIRTDLDSFSWLESDALMLSGYRMAASEWDKCMSNIVTSPDRPVQWDFQKLELAMTATDESAPVLPKLKRSLTVAEGLAFKPFELYPSLKVAGRVGIVLAVLTFIGTIWLTWGHTPSLGLTIVIVAGTVLAVRAVEIWVFRPVLRYRNSFLQVIGSFIMCTVGWAIFYPYLKWIDPLYVRWGSQYRAEPAPKPEISNEKP